MTDLTPSRDPQPLNLDIIMERAAGNIPAPAAPKPVDGLVEQIAQFLHDEGGFGEAWVGRTWPEHRDDTGQRDGGFVKIVPYEVQAQFRDAARRLVRRFKLNDTTTRIEGLEASIAIANKQCAEMVGESSVLRRELAETREVLEWYGEQARLCRLIHSEGDAGRNALAEDGGKRARTLFSRTVASEEK